MEQEPGRRFPQSAVISIVEEDGELKVVLITSARSVQTDLWGILKGLVESQLSLPESAENEAWEEAGLRGDVEKTPIGFYEYKKLGGTCEVDVYSTHVTEILDQYPEQGFRRRIIVDLESACSLVANKDVALILHKSSRNIENRWATSPCAKLVLSFRFSGVRGSGADYQSARPGFDIL